MSILLLLLAAGLSSFAAAEPKVGANEILTEALEALRTLPSGRPHWQFLAEKGLTLSISREGVPPKALSVADLKTHSLVFGAEALDGAFSEMEAHGVGPASTIAKHMGVKLAPSLAHEACHAEIAGLLKQAAGAVPPAFLEEETICLYEELLAWRDLGTAYPFIVRRTRTELDRTRDRIAALLVGDPPELLKRVGEHYRGLPVAGTDPTGRLAAFFIPPMEPSPISARLAAAERTIGRLDDDIRAGGKNLLRQQSALARAEEAKMQGVELSSIHAPRPGGDSRTLVAPASYRKMRAFLTERLSFLSERLKTDAWTDWRHKEYPDRRFHAAATDEERLSAALAAALKSAHEAPDLLREGNPYYFRTARQLARKLGRDIRAAEKEITTLQERKIRRLLEVAEKLAPSEDSSMRRWAYLCLLRVEMESRETWDMTPNWISTKERLIVDVIKAAGGG